MADLPSDQWLAKKNFLGYIRSMAGGLKQRRNQEVQALANDTKLKAYFEANKVPPELRQQHIINQGIQNAESKARADFKVEQQKAGFPIFTPDDYKKMLTEDHKDYIPSAKEQAEAEASGTDAKLNYIQNQMPADIDNEFQKNQNYIPFDEPQQTQPTSQPASIQMPPINVSGANASAPVSAPASIPHPQMPSPDAVTQSINGLYNQTNPGQSALPAVASN